MAKASTAASTEHPSFRNLDLDPEVTVKAGFFTTAVSTGTSSTCGVPNYVKLSFLGYIHWLEITTKLIKPVCSKSLLICQDQTIHIFKHVFSAVLTPIRCAMKIQT